MSEWTQLLEKANSGDLKSLRIVINFANHELFNLQTSRLPQGIRDRLAEIGGNARNLLHFIDGMMEAAS